MKIKRLIYTDINDHFILVLNLNSNLNFSALEFIKEFNLIDIHLILNIHLKNNQKISISLKKTNNNLKSSKLNKEEKDWIYKFINKLYSSLENSNSSQININDIISNLENLSN